MMTPYMKSMLKDLLKEKVDERSSLFHRIRMMEFDEETCKRAYMRIDDIDRQVHTLKVLTDE